MDYNNYRLSSGLNIASVALNESRRMKEDIDFVNESMSDILKVSTLATLLSIPGLVSANEIVDHFGKDRMDDTVEVSDPHIQKGLRDAIGDDMRYADAIRVNVIARTLMGEAVGESAADAIDAVATVIWNRMGGDKRNTFDVIFEPEQFSCWNAVTGGRQEDFVWRCHGQAPKNPSKWKYCVETAKKIVDGKFTPLDDWNAFYATSIKAPSWGPSLKNTKTIGNHIFGRDDTRKVKKAKSADGSAN